MAQKTLKERVAKFFGLLTADVVTTIVPELVERTDETEKAAARNKDEATDLDNKAQVLLYKAAYHTKTAQRQEKAVDQVRRALGG